MSISEVKNTIEPGIYRGISFDEYAAWDYANATILGGQTVIGKGVEVSGNTFITKSITEHTVVAQDVPKLRVMKKHAEDAPAEGNKQGPEDPKSEKRR